MTTTLGLALNLRVDAPKACAKCGRPLPRPQLTPDEPERCTRCAGCEAVEAGDAIAGEHEGKIYCAPCCDALEATNAVPYMEPVWRDDVADGERCAHCDVRILGGSTDAD